ALGEERSYLWAVTADSITTYELPKRELIQQAATRVTELLTARGLHQRNETPSQRAARIATADAQLPTAAKQLSELVLAPAAARLANQRLLIVPDGQLQYVPFGMLPKLKDEGGRMKDEGSHLSSLHPSSFRLHPLIVEHEIITLP